jgi:hypothetical protein
VEKDTVSIFRAEVAMLGTGYFILGLMKGRLRETTQSERRNEKKWSEPIG